MSLIKKLYLLVKFNKTAKVVIEETEKVIEVKKKSGIHSTEFLITILASLGSIVAAANGALPPLYAAIAASLSTAFYTLSRGMVKQPDPKGGEKSGYKTSEFYVGLLSDLGALLAATSGAVAPEVAAVSVTVSRVSYSISRALAKQA